MARLPSHPARFRGGLRTLQSLALIGVMVACGGCRSQELARKAKLQQIEIQRLQDELTRLEAEFKACPPDRAKEMPAATTRLDSLQKEQARLAVETDTLQARKDEVAKEDLTYRARHPYKTP